MAVRPSTAAALLLALSFVAPSMASAQIPDSTIPLQTVISETYRFRIEYAENYNKKDVPALAAMYAPDAIITTEDGATYVGREAITAALTKMAPTFPHIIITSDSMVAFGRTAIDVGTTTMHPQAGGELKSHYLAVLRRGTDRQWKVVRLSVVSVPKT